MKPKHFNYLILTAMALSGAAALTYEVVVSKSLSYFFGSSTYSIATMLAAFMLGLGIGSIVMARYLPRIRNKRLTFAVMQFSIGSFALLFLTNLGLIPAVFNAIYTTAQPNLAMLTFAKFFIGIIFLLIPTILLGASFPLASSMLIKDVKKAGSDVGTLYGLDTFGSIVGAVAAGFIFLPVIGLKLTAMTGAFLSFASGFILLRKRQKHVAAYCIGLALILGIFLGIQNNNIDGSETIFFDENESYTPENVYSSEDRIVFEQNSPFGIVSVKERIISGSSGQQVSHYRLFIDGRVKCNSIGNRERTLAHLAMANFDNTPTDERVNVLNIGLGCGLTLGALLGHENVEQVDNIEINQVVVDVAKTYFAKDNGYALEDPRAEIIIDDASHFIFATDKKYDLIIVDLDPSLPKGMPFYTIEYLKIMGSLLENDGILSMPALYRDYEYLNNLYHTLKEVFPYVYLTKENDETLFFTSRQELDVEAMKNNLRYMYTDDFEDFEQELVEQFEDSSYILNTMDYPILEHIIREKYEGS